ncbi:hypothetical protein Tco_0493527 [Tanacetum coccineum]
MENVIFSEMAMDMEVHFDMTMRQKIFFKCLCAPHAQDFLLAIPIDGLGQHMSPVKYRIILKYRLMIPLFPVDAICPFVARHVWIPLGNMRFLVKSSRDSNTYTIWLGTSFLTYLVEGHSYDASLPIRFGGLGLYSEKLVSFYAFVASRAQSWVLQDHILRDSGICGMDDDYVSALLVFVIRFQALILAVSLIRTPIFKCLCAPHAQDFLLAIPIDGLGQHMSPVKYRTILKYRLMIPLFSVDAICLVCRKACLDSFGEHVVHCKELSGFKYRHDMVKDVLFDIFRRVGISA